MKEHQSAPAQEDKQLESTGKMSMMPPGFSTHSSGSDGDGGGPPIQRMEVLQLQEEDVDLGSARGDAKALHDAMDGWGTDEAKVIRTLRGKSRAHLKEVMRIFQSSYGGSLHSWISDEMSGQDYKSAMINLMPALSILARLELQKGWFDDNEEAMVEVVKTSSGDALVEARADGRVRAFLESELNATDMLETAKYLYPNEIKKYTVRAIQSADGWFWDDEENVIMLLLDLSPSDRKSVWADNRESFKMFSGYKSNDVDVNPSSDFGKVMVVCVGTQAQALDSAMDLATDGLGTYDDLASKVVTETGEAVQTERALEGAMNGEGSESLSDEQRAEMQGQLDQLGKVEETLLSVDDNATELESGSFLEKLQGDVSGGEFEAFTAQMGMDQFDRAKRMILDAMGLWDDEEKVYRAIESIQDPAVKAKLMADTDVQTALKANFNTEEIQTADAFGDNDTYSIAIHKLNNTKGWFSWDWGEFFTLLMKMSAEDRERLKTENPAQFTFMLSWASSTQKAALEEILETGSISTEIGMAYATIGGGTDDPFLTTMLEKMGSEERLTYRAGYALANGHTIPESFMDADAQTDALSKYKTLLAQLEGDLSHDDLQKALDVLVSAPTLPEYTEDGGYELISFILNQRVVDKGATRDGGLGDGFVDMFSNTGGTADVAEMAARSQYDQMTADGTVEDGELATLGYLEKEFGEKHEEYVAAIDTVSDIASTVAAIAAAIAVTVATAGSGGAAAAAALASYLGTSSTVVIAATAATLAGATKLGVSEAIGGEHNDVTEEGAQDFFVGGAEGAMVVLTAGIAKALHASFGKLVGLRGTALASEMSIGSLRAADMTVRGIGKQFGTGAVRGVIDGVISGSVGELVITAMDEDTYRKSVWDTLTNFGAAFLRGAAMGAAGGAIGGGVMDAMSLVVGKTRLPALLAKLESAGFGPEHIDNLNPHQGRMLAEIDKAIQEGNRESAETAFQKLARDLDPEDAARIRKVLFGEIIEVSDDELARFRTRLLSRIEGKNGFASPHSDDDLRAIIQKGKELGLPESEIHDFLFISCREAKSLDAHTLIQQMDNWVNVVQQRGFPYKFNSLEEFNDFKKELLQGLEDSGVSTSDVRVQGSSLRTEAAGDVDLVAFLDNTEFDSLLQKRFNGRATKDGTVLILDKMGHDELVYLAKDIVANPNAYNGQAKTFAHAMNESAFNSKGTILKALKIVKKGLATKYPHLNIETIGIQVRGGNFDLEPFMRLK